MFTTTTPKRRRSVALAALALSVALTGAARAQLHLGDIGLLERDGQIVTGRVGGDGHSVESHRVFDRYLGIEGFPNWVDVGYDSPTGEFNPHSAIGFNILAGLKLWQNEHDGFRLLDPATEETVTINFGSGFATSGAAFTEGFTVGVNPNNGEFHRHYWFGLNNPVNGGGAIYLLEFEKYSTDSALEPTHRAAHGEYGASDPFWILLGHHGSVDPGEMAKAFAYVETHFIGEAFVLGDFNGDGVLSGLDIPGFKQALADPDGWAGANPDRPHPNTLGDFNIDGVFSGLDIPGFKQALAGGSATTVPEPSTALLLLGGLLLSRRRFRRPSRG